MPPSMQVGLMHRVPEAPGVHPSTTPRQACACGRLESICKALLRRGQRELDSQHLPGPTKRNLSKRERGIGRA